MKERIDTMIEMMNHEKEVRIYVDIRADGTGHAQAALNVAERLRIFGYTEQIVFILGCTIFTPFTEEASVRMTYNPDWVGYYERFTDLLQKRIPIENYSVFSQDCLQENRRGKFLRRVIRHDLWHELLKDYISAINSETGQALDYEPCDDTNFERLFKYKQKEVINASAASSAGAGLVVDKSGVIDRESTVIAFDKGSVRLNGSKTWIEFPFEREAKFGFSGAADVSVNPCHVLNTEFCIALQPRDWKKGGAGIYRNGRFSQFNEEIASLTMTTLAVDQIEARYQKYRRTFARDIDNSLKLLLDKHIAGKNVILLYNPSFMHKTIDNTTFLNNLKIMFSGREKDTLFIELRLPDKPSLWSSALDEDEDEAQNLRTRTIAQFNVLNLSDLLEETNLPHNSVILCEYLPTPIVDYLMTKAVALLCEGQGMAQKALEIGLACLHSPVNVPRGIYEKATEHDEDGKKKLQLIVDYLVNSPVAVEKSGLGHDYLSSECVRVFCNKIKKEQGSLERDQLAHAIDTLAHLVKPRPLFARGIESAYKKYRSSQIINSQLERLLDKHIRGRELIIIHNPGLMGKTIDNMSLLNNLNLCFSRNCANVLYIEMHSSEDVHSLWSHGLEASSEEEFKMIDLDELPDEDIPNGSVISCKSLPHIVQEYLIQRSMLVLCADSKIALTAVNTGVPCIHSPTHDDRVVYDRLPLRTGDELTLGKDLLSAVSLILLTFKIDPHRASVARDIYKNFRSSPVTQLCIHLMVQQEQRARMMNANAVFLPAHFFYIRKFEEAEFSQVKDKSKAFVCAKFESFIKSKEEEQKVPICNLRARIRLM